MNAAASVFVVPRPLVPVAAKSWVAFPRDRQEQFQSSSSGSSLFLRYLGVIQSVDLSNDTQGLSFGVLVFDGFPSAARRLGAPINCTQRVAAAQWCCGHSCYVSRFEGHVWLETLCGR